MIDEEDPFYLRTVCDYVHLNAVRARLLADGEALSTFRWSSYGSYLEAQRLRPTWLRVDRLLGEHGIGSDSARGRREFGRRMEEQRFIAEDGGLQDRVRRGWQFGAEDFADRLRERMSSAAAERHEAAYVRESMIGRALRIIDEELSGARLDAGALEALSKGAPVKIAIARRLRESTTLNLKEITSLLHAGSWRSLANALSRKNESI